MEFEETSANVTPNAMAAKTTSCRGESPLSVSQGSQNQGELASSPPSPSISSDQSMASASTTSCVTTSKTSRKRKLNILELLECPVCLEHPRKSPIYSCFNGHIMCSPCSAKVHDCPVCRDKRIKCRNIVLDQILEFELSDKKLSCSQQQNGCKHVNFKDRLAEHEAICVFRKVSCPARLRGACSWTGNLHEVLQHVNREKCAQLIRMDEESRTYYSVMGDYNNRKNSVFSSVSSHTNWKPVLMLSKDHIRLFAYLITYRTMSGEWVTYLRSFTGSIWRKKVIYKLTLRRPRKSLWIKDTNTYDEDDNRTEDGKYFGPEYSMQGEMMSSSATEEEVLRSGMCLRLKDSQVKKLAIGPTLFEWEVELKQKLMPETNQNNHTNETKLCSSFDQKRIKLENE